MESPRLVVSPKRSLLPDQVEDYLARVVTRESPLLARLREETGRLPEAGMQIGADQGALLALLVRLSGARQVLELGTFTGYSALVLAEALPAEGRLTTCDLSEPWTAMARRYWQAAGLEQRIELRLGPAAQTLERLEQERGRSCFDLAFIDADKPSYDRYYEDCLRLVRPGGLLALDNMLWSGRVADAANQEDNTVLLRALAHKISRDVRVESCLVSIGDGLMLARRTPGR